MDGDGADDGDEHVDDDDDEAGSKDLGEGADGDNKAKKKKTKKKKGKKGAKTAAAAFRINLDDLPPQERAIQEEMLSLAATMGLRRAEPKKAASKDATAKEATAMAVPKPPAPTLFSLIQACPHVELPACTCSRQILPDTRKTFMAELDQSQCLVHQTYFTKPDRVKEREPSLWMEEAVRRRVQKKYTPSVGEIFQGVVPTVITRHRAHEVIEAYTEVGARGRRQTWGWLLPLRFWFGFEGGRVWGV